MKARIKINGKCTDYVTGERVAFTRVFIAREFRDVTDYGNGIYVSIINENTREPFKYIDARYMSGYTLEKLIDTVMREYYGENLETLEIAIIPD